MNKQSKYILILSFTGEKDDELHYNLIAKGFFPQSLSAPAFSTEALMAKPPKAIIVKSYDDPIVNDVLNAIKASYPYTSIPVLALHDNIPTLANDNHDSILIAPYHPMQIVLRTMGLIRLAVMEQEISLRLLTLKDSFNQSPEISSVKERNQFKILFIGKASPEFMVIINALQKEKVDVSAAFTSFTAFDYLYEQTFDAVVMNGLKGIEPAYSVTQTMRKNAKLYHVPALLLVNADSFTDYELIYNAGVNDIVDAKSPLKDISSRILEQANFHRTHLSLKEEFGTLGDDNCKDELTGLYNHKFFNAHMSRVSKYYYEQDLPSSLCLIRVRSKNAPLSTKQEIMAYKQIGSMIKNIVRLNDLTARLDKNVFAIVFPGQSVDELNSVAERIKSILKLTSISDIETGRPLNIELDITFTTLEEDQPKESIA